MLNIERHFKVEVSTTRERNREREREWVKTFTLYHDTVSSSFANYKNYE